MILKNYLVENNMHIITIYDLKSARAELSQISHPVKITNSPHIVKYYGILVIDYIFKSLTAEYGNIKQVILQIESDKAAFYTAIKLGYLDQAANPDAVYLIKA